MCILSYNYLVSYCVSDCIQFYQRQGGTTVKKKCSYLKSFSPTCTVVSLPSPSTVYALKLECRTELWGCRINLKSFPSVLKWTSLIVLKGWLDNFAPRFTTWCANFDACIVSKYLRLWYIEPRNTKHIGKANKHNFWECS